MKSLERVFYIILYSTYFIYITGFIGLASFAPEYLETLQATFNLYISCILIWRFHPWRHHKFTPFDQKIIFSAALFILSSTSLTKLTSLFTFHEKIPEDQFELFSRQ